MALLTDFVSLAEAKEDFSLSTDAAFHSRYVWRGALLSDCWVFQPSATFDYQGLGLAVWGNMDLGNANGKDYCFSELDYDLNLSFPVGYYSFSLGGMLYTYPNTLDKATTEIYLGLKADLLLNPSVTVFQDVDEAKGTYISLNLGHSLPVKKLNGSVDLALSVGIGTDKHSRYYHEVNSGALVDFLISAIMPFKIKEGITIAPSFSYARLLDSKIGSSAEKKDNPIFGLTFSAAF